MPIMLSKDKIGGAYVRRRFDLGPRTVLANEVLTAEQVREIPTTNLKALVNVGYLELYPMAPVPKEARRFAIHMGMGKFDVIEGQKLNASPLTQDEAYAMLPKDQRPKGRRPSQRKPKKTKAAG